jgi:predicted CoA-substrate-specific enzyme activase
LTTAGIDAGSDYLKVVLLGNGDVLAWYELRYGMAPVIETAQKALDSALEKAGIARGDIDRIAATGINREKVTLADRMALESLCCARGVNSLMPDARTIVDLGSDKTTVVRCENGSILRTARHDRCAAGTARYLDVALRILQVPEEEAGAIALKSSREVSLQATCTVFVESEVISLIHQGQRAEDILKGIFTALARRIYPLLIKVNYQREVVLLGGIAGNLGIIAAFEEQLGDKVGVPEHPAIVEALGAAMIARDV